MPSTGGRLPQIDIFHIEFLQIRENRILLNHVRSISRPASHEEGATNRACQEHNDCNRTKGNSRSASGVRWEPFRRCLVRLDRIIAIIRFVGGLLAQGSLVNAIVVVENHEEQIASVRRIGTPVAMEVTGGVTINYGIAIRVNGNTSATSDAIITTGAHLFRPDLLPVGCIHHGNKDVVSPSTFCRTFEYGSIFHVTGNINMALTGDLGTSETDRSCLSIDVARRMTYLVLRCPQYIERIGFNLRQNGMNSEVRFCFSNGIIHYASCGSCDVKESVLIRVAANAQNPVITARDRREVGHRTRFSSVRCKLSRVGRNFCHDPIKIIVSFGTLRASNNYQCRPFIDHRHSRNKNGVLVRCFQGLSPI
mmetsp:Transcript_7778/g.22786  ORF Transcript_7778/g.22786 Transcript_7778/m.22786 type:complete len:365 (-) Transcript_7778:1864-2958(-)